MDKKINESELIKSLKEKGLLNKDILNAINELAGKDNMGHNIEAENVRVKESVHEFVKYLKNELSESTISSYKSDLEGFYTNFYKTHNFAEINESILVPAISTDDIQKYFNKLLSTGYSIETIRRNKHSLKKYFEFLENFDYKAPDIETIHIQKREMNIDALTDGEVRGIAEYAETIKGKLMILFMYEATMRRQELIDCKKEYIDLEKKIVMINVNDKFDRVGYFSDEVKHLIEQYTDEWEMEVKEINDKRYNRKLTKGAEYKELKVSDYLFQTSYSDQISYATIYKIIREAAFEYYLNKAYKEGISEAEAKEIAEEKAKAINTDTIRHSRRAYLLASGYSLDQVQIMMGDENKYAIKRYMKIAHKLYPDIMREKV